MTTTTAGHGTVAPTEDVPDGSRMAYRYRAWGDLPDPVRAELRLRHQAGNMAVAAWKKFDAAWQAAWEEDPVVAPLLAAVRQAEETAQAAAEAASRAGSREGYAKQAGNTARAEAAKAQAKQARAERAAANRALAEARARVRAEKGMRKGAVDRLQDHARQAYEEELKGIYPWYVASGGYWANALDLLAYHKVAARRVTETRSQGRPAELSYRRWDGTGTVTVALMRHPGISAELRAEVTRRKAAGESARSIGADLGMTPMAVAKMKAEGPVTAGQPLRTPAVLASPASPWRGVTRVTRLPDGFAGMRRGDRRRAARTAVMTRRTGSEASRAVSELPLVMHRPMRDDADITLARVTVSRAGPDLLMHVSFTARLPAPPAAAGRLVRVHAGWRALPDGSLRVAVITGAGPLPASLAAPAGPGGGKSELDGCVTNRGGCWEVTLPPAWRAQMDAQEALRSRRDTDRDRVRDAAAAWIAAHPQPAVPDGGGGPVPLPAPHEVRQWRAGGRQADRPLWRREARGRAALIARRNDLYGRVAAWACAGAGEIRGDNWDMRDMIRRPQPGGDDPQAAAARANRVLAAPGELQKRLKVTAGLAGVAVTVWVPPRGGQVHAGCGGELDPDLRRAQVRVPCGRCGRMVDQDWNVLDLMGAGR